MQKPPYSQSQQRRSKQRPRRDLDLRVPVTPYEKARVTWGATGAELSTASYLRQLGLGRRPRAAVDRHRIHNLLGVNGDVGRFGGLLKLWLTDDAKLDLFEREWVRALANDAQETKRVLRQAAERALSESYGHATPIGEPYMPEHNPPRRKQHLHVPVTSEEEGRIKHAATSRDVPVATYLRDRGLRYRPLCTLNAAYLRELEARAEALAQEGDLLKRWLVDDPRLMQGPAHKVQRVVSDAMAQARVHLLNLRMTAERTP